MLDPIGTKRPIDTDEDAAKRQRSQEEQAAALGQLPGVAALAFAPLAAPLQQQQAATQSLLLVPEQPQEAQQLAATQSLLLQPEPPQDAQQLQTQLQHPTLAEPGEKKICFPFLNRGMCQFSSQCKFRHLMPEHPDAIADRVRTGHTHRLAGFTGDAAAEVQAQVASAPPPVPPPAPAESRICFSFLNHGTCERAESCRFRHLPADHPDAVADRIRTGQYAKIPQHVNPMVEQNPRCPPGERRICYNFLNRGSCDKPDCGFRHLLPGHPDAIADKMRSRAPMEMGMAMQMAGSRMPGFSWDGARWQPSAGGMWPPAGGVPRGMYGAHGMYGMGMQGGMPGGMQGGMQGGMNGGMNGGMHGGMQGGMQRMPAQHVPDPGEMRICFTFLNRGQCNREGSCRFRHLAPDHPDAIADRIRTGRLPAQMAPGASAGAPTQLDMLAMGTVPWGGGP